MIPAGIVVAAKIACFFVPQALHWLNQGPGLLFERQGLSVIVLSVDVACDVISMPTSLAMAVMDANGVFRDVQALHPKPGLAHVYPRFMRGQGR